LTGYIGAKSFLDAVLSVVQRLRTANPQLMFVCDPVMGDVSAEDPDTVKLYVPAELVDVYREKVVPVADVIVPNQYEAQLLTNSPRIVSLEDAHRVCDQLHRLGPQTVVITSLYLPSHPGQVILVGSRSAGDSAPAERFHLVFARQDGHYTGMGDLFAALLLGWLVRGRSLREACESAVASSQAVITRTRESSSKELRLLESAPDLLKPPSFVGQSASDDGV